MNHNNSGLAHGTKGSSQITFENTELEAISNKLENALHGPIQSTSDLIYDQNKTENYLLNVSHPVGGSKAVFFLKDLGYTQQDSKLFHENVAQSILGREPTVTEKTPYGTKYTFHTTLRGKNSITMSANVVVVVQKDNNKLTFRIITVYPDKKGGK